MNISESKLLYFGQSTWGINSLQRYNVLSQIAKSTYMVDSRRVLPDKNAGRTVFNSIQARVGIGNLIQISSKILLQEISRFQPDIVWIDGGYLV